MPGCWTIQNTQELGQAGFQFDLLLIFTQLHRQKTTALPLIQLATQAINWANLFLILLYFARSSLLNSAQKQKTDAGM